MGGVADQQSVCGQEIAVESRNQKKKIIVNRLRLSCTAGSGQEGVTGGEEGCRTTGKRCFRPVEILFLEGSRGATLPAPLLGAQ